MGLNDADDTEFRHKNLLIYCPRPPREERGRPLPGPVSKGSPSWAPLLVTRKRQPPSLARQAMPELAAAEIDRLFEEGRPTLAMLDNLKAGDSFPLINDCLGTEDPLDVVARILCAKGTVARITAGTPGVIDELQRLLQKEFGYSPPLSVTKVEAKLEALGAYVLLSEFAFDLEAPLTGLADESSRCAARAQTAYLCPLRPDATKRRFPRGIHFARSTLRDRAWRLRDLFVSYETLGERDTFPFEERHCLAQIPALAAVSKLEEASRHHHGPTQLGVVDSR